MRRDPWWHPMGPSYGESTLERPLAMAAAVELIAELAFHTLVHQSQPTGTGCSAARSTLHPEARANGLLRAAMSGGKATIGVDFGTESARAVLVDVASGRELASAVHRFRSGVIDQQLPGGGTALPPDWALQDPDDYLEALGATVRAVLAESRIDVTQVIGIGIDFTACTMLPVTAEGNPLSRESDLRQNPHAWVKLWKHHAAQPEADLINDMAAKSG